MRPVATIVSKDSSSKGDDKGFDEVEIGVTHGSPISRGPQRTNWLPAIGPSSSHRGRRRLLLAVLCLAGPLAASAHIGNPTTIYEGMAGPTPVRVSIRVPSVVPGLAEINVRAFT